jgi:parallel beta-helix repeat protein
VALGVGLVVVSLPAEDTFTDIDYPGASATYARGINDAGDIVGFFMNADNLARGFLLRGGKFTEIHFPDARQTWAWGINSRGDISGYYGVGGITHGFRLSSEGVFTSLDCPGDGVTVTYGINSAGDIAGYFTPPGKPSQGLIWSRGVCTLSEYRPDAARRTMTMYFGINDAGVAVGHWATDGGYSTGLVFRKGTFAQNDHGGGGNVVHWGINSAGDIVGSFRDGNRFERGFLLSNGRFTPIELPGMVGGAGFGINSSGQIVGAYGDSARRSHGFLARIAPSGAPPAIQMVDDDGIECPGAVRNLQEAVKRAVPGSTILVCPGTYLGTVNIVGPEKTGLKLIAAGRQDEVVLQGDNHARDGFHLENVTNVLIRGFTVRDFGSTATTAGVWGVGNQIYLENAHYSVIENNRLINGDRMGIMLVNSGNNTVERNVAWVDNAALATCGIHVEGAKSTGNTIRLNVTYGNQVAGITIRAAGPGNSVTDNTVVSNGRSGIDVQNTDDIWIEGNRVSYNRGFWGTTPGGQQAGLGINLVNVNKATVFDNRARNNSGVDLNWDGKGENKLDANACDKSTPAGACAR